LTEWNSSRRFQGHSDIPLNEIGRQQAEALAARLSSEHIHAMYASDLERAQATTRVIAARQKCTSISDARLREIGFGAWEGLTYDEIRRRDLAALSRWESNAQEAAPPGGETLDQLARRVQPVLDEICARHVDETVLIVAHGGPLQVLLCLALGLAPRMYWQFHLSPASISEVAFWPAGAILNLLNDTCHLNGANRWLPRY
jgi:broad specificity phosphatase PhoE